jgi:NAD(P)-dependent dehydrogenase (short-subunit alcohol dehydrogenase family)
MKLNSSRRQLIQTGIASAAGLTTVGISQTRSINAQAESPSENTNNKNRFAQKIVLITGATSGIGRAAAVAFAREGAKVGFCGRRANLGAEVEQLIRDRGGDATYIKADVTQPNEVGQLVDTLNRFATAEEMAEAALFLASNDCPYITGTDLLADGGMMSGL